MDQREDEGFSILNLHSFSSYLSLSSHSYLYSTLLYPEHLTDIFGQIYSGQVIYGWARIVT